MSSKKRVDVLLVERGLAESRSQAQRLVMAGQVRLAGQVVVKPSTTVPEDADLTFDSGPPFVSRGGDKLQAALEAFEVSVAGKFCVDVGASTGGFTDCLLQHGAAKVYAVDVGQGILHWKLRQDARVVVMEGTNARYLEKLPGPIDIVTIDASFISLKLLLLVVKSWFQGVGGEVIALIKPQFEAGKETADKGQGVIRDPAVHKQVLEDVLVLAQDQGYGIKGLIKSPLQGPKGNVEFLGWLAYPGETRREIPALIDGCGLLADN